MRGLCRLMLTHSLQEESAIFWGNRVQVARMVENGNWGMDLRLLDTQCLSILLSQQQQGTLIKSRCAIADDAITDNTCHSNSRLPAVLLVCTQDTQDAHC